MSQTRLADRTGGTKKSRLRSLTATCAVIAVVAVGFVAGSTR
jgi:hypothetical protein